MSTNKSKIVFSSDKRSATEGDFVVVSWECWLPDAVTLTIENGYESSRMQLPDSGTRTIAIRKSKGKTTLRLVASFGGRVERKELDIKVKNLRPVRAKVYRARPQRGRVWRPKEWFSSLGYRWRSFCQRVVYGWRALPERKRRTYKLLLVLLVAMWIGSLMCTAGYNAGYERGVKDAMRTEQTSLG